MFKPRYQAAVFAAGLSAFLLSGCAPMGPEEVDHSADTGVPVVKGPSDNERDPSSKIETLEDSGYVYSGRQLLRMLPGKTTYGRMNGRVGEWAEYFSPDGRAIFKNRHGEISDGTWWVSGKQVCFAYGRQSTAYCNYAVQKDGIVQYVLTNGKRDYYITRFERGDSENLVEAVLDR